MIAILIERIVPIIVLIVGVSFIIYKTQFSVPHKAYIDESIAYLKSNRPVKRKAYVPTESIYARLQENCSDMANLSAMAQDIFRHLGLPNNSIPVHPLPEIDGRAAGRYVHDATGNYIEVRVLPYTRADEVIAVLIHECMHYYLRATALGFEDRMKNEILTDTATIYFGFFECINRGYIHAGYIGYSEIKYIDRKLKQSL